jgi:hypothetical protein
MVASFIRQNSSKLGTLNTVVIFLFHILFYCKNLSTQGFKKIIFFIFALLCIYEKRDKFSSNKVLCLHFI